MSKKLEAKITCPHCNCIFDMELYRSIWGEYPENKELVLSDKINVAHCPNCHKDTKLAFSLLYTNTPKKIAVWWEPEFDQQVEKDIIAYKLNAPKSYLANAQRIRDWNEFKNKIIELEKETTESLVSVKAFNNEPIIGTIKTDKDTTIVKNSRIGRKEYIWKSILLCFFYSLAKSWHIFFGFVLSIPFLLMMSDIIIKRSHDINKKGYIPVILLTLSVACSFYNLTLPISMLLAFILSFYDIFFLILKKGEGKNKYGDELPFNKPSALEQLGALIVFIIICFRLFIMGVIIEGFIR